MPDLCRHFVTNFQSKPGIFTYFLKFWETFQNWKKIGNFRNLGKNWVIFENFGNFWETRFGKYSTLGGDCDWAPGRYFRQLLAKEQETSRTVTDWRSLSSAIMNYNCVSMDYCAIIESFQVITRRLTRRMRAAGYKRNFALETDHHSRQLRQYPSWIFDARQQNGYLWLILFAASRSFC